MEELQDEGSSVLYSSSRFITGDICRKHKNLKAMPGRVRKLLPWVEFVHLFLDDGFERMLDLGVKVS